MHYNVYFEIPASLRAIFIDFPDTLLQEIGIMLKVIVISIPSILAIPLLYLSKQNSSSFTKISVFSFYLILEVKDNYLFCLSKFLKHVFEIW